MEHLKEGPSYKQLQREVHLKQLQINGLMAITEAINDNAKASHLFISYRKFLHMELQVGTLALYFKEDAEWQCVSQYGFDPKLLPSDMSGILGQFVKRTPLAPMAHDPFLGLFDLVIPVFHKENPLAYAFIGDLKEEDDILSNINFITTITNIITVAIENKRLFKEQADKEIISHEMVLAGQIQRTLIPHKLPSSTKVQFVSLYKPHFAVGGDYFDVVELPDDQIVFCIADISGKGISAALLMANFQAKLHALLLRGLGLEETIREMNAYVHQITNGDRFITLFLAKYDPANLALEYVNAGHVPPMIMTDGECIKLQSGCTVLGFVPVLPQIDVGGICITSKEALFFSYTDGLTDTQNQSGDFYEEELLVSFLEKSRSLPITQLPDRLLSEITEFKGKTAFLDDITVLACKLLH